MSDTLFSFSLTSTALVWCALLALFAGLIGWAIAYVRYRGEIVALISLDRCSDDSRQTRKPFPTPAKRRLPIWSNLCAKP